jgi:hypothetical protein
LIVALLGLYAIYFVFKQLGRLIHS